jgi:proteasome alpha subunit
MVYSPYDWNQAVSQRTEYIEERIRDGSPVVGISLPEGALLVSIHQTQRKLYEVYDRITFGGIGNQSDLETARNGAIDFAHREGFQRSPDDVTLQRLVGSALSPAIKRAFADPFNVPFVFRGLFAELAEKREEDTFAWLNYDGEYAYHHDFCVVAGSLEAENEVTRLLHGAAPGISTLEGGIRLALEAWATGKIHARRRIDDEESEGDKREDPAAVLREALTTGTLEAALLERGTRRESKFRLLKPSETDAATAEYR